MWPRFAIWIVVTSAVIIPIAIASTSPFLAWRSPVYIAGCFAGIFALAIVFLQPILAMNMLPGLHPRKARRVHKILGQGLFISVIAHVGLLWITSPPDIIDALLFRSPTPFAPFGVLAMWAVFLSAICIAFRKRLRRHASTIHITLALIIVSGTIIHAVLIQGLMGQISKTILCAMAAVAMGWVVYKQLKRP